MFKKDGEISEAMHSYSQSRKGYKSVFLLYVLTRIYTLINPHVKTGTRFCRLSRLILLTGF